MTFRVRVAANVFARDFDGEVVLLDLARGDYYGLDAIGARLWNGLMAGRTASEVAAQIGPEYDVEPDVIEQDLHALVDDLLARGLVEKIDDGSDPNAKTNAR